MSQKPTPPPDSGQDRPRLREHLRGLPHCVDVTEQSVRAGKVFAVIGDVLPKPVPDEAAQRQDED
jgi:hypothetical protein